MLVKDIMTTKLITVGPKASVRDVAEILVNHKISGVPVVDEEGKILGIVSEGDLLCKATSPEIPDGLCILGAVIFYSGVREYRRAFKKLAAMDAEEIMTAEVVNLPPDAEVGEAAKIMQEKHIKRVPIVDKQNHLLGIVTRQDIVKMLLAED